MAQSSKVRQTAKSSRRKRKIVTPRYGLARTWIPPPLKNMPRVHLRKKEHLKDRCRPIPLHHLPASGWADPPPSVSGVVNIRKSYKTSFFFTNPLRTTQLARLFNISSTSLSTYPQSTMSTTTTTTTSSPQPITAENVIRLFPDVDTHLSTFHRNPHTSHNDLDGYDSEQVRLMDEVCIVLDHNDNPIGSASKKTCNVLIPLPPSQNTSHLTPNVPHSQATS